MDNEPSRSCQTVMMWGAEEARDELPPQIIGINQSQYEFEKFKDQRSTK